MTIDIQTLIQQRPHLKNPLEVYLKWQRFRSESAHLLHDAGKAVSSERVGGYPRSSLRPILLTFFSSFDLQATRFEPLAQALEEGNIDFLRLPIGEIPDFPSLVFLKQELEGLLFLLSKPYFMALKESSVTKDFHWKDGRCPLCSAKPALASIVDGPKRLLHCSYCGTHGSYLFLGCPNCQTDDPEKLNTFVSDDEPGFRVVACDQCQGYMKVVEGSIFNNMTMDLADLASLPLDIMTQEKGYVRLVPNPIGLKKIV